MNRILIAMLMPACGGGSSSDRRSIEASDEDTCPTGEQAMWTKEETVACQAFPTWPPAANGSRDVPAECMLSDGSYSLAWHSDVQEDVRPAFSVAHVMAIEGNHMFLDEYSYGLQWVDAATADAYGPIDFLEFIVSCGGLGVRGSITVNLPYYNPGHQIETWTLTGVPNSK